MMEEIQKVLCGVKIGEHARSRDEILQNGDSLFRKSVRVPKLP